MSLIGPPDELSSMSMPAGRAPETAPLLQRIGILAELPALVEELGGDAVELAHRVGISSEVLLDSDAVIPFVKFGAAFQVAQSLTGCPHIGLLLGSRGSLGMLGLVGAYMADAPTVGTAMTDISSHQRRYVRGARPYVVAANDEVLFGYRVHEAIIPAFDQLCEAAIAYGNAMIMELCGERPIEILFSHAAPADKRPYQSILKAPVRFNAEHNALVYPGSILCRPVPDADPFRRLKLHAKLEQYWAIEPPDIVSSLRRILAVTALDGDHSLRTTAAALKLHPRALNRRLREQNTTFQRELAHTRFTLACQFLENSRLSITAIAEAFGYADVSVFTRAFERWSGITPTQCRKNHAQRPGPSAP